MTKILLTGTNDMQTGKSKWCYKKTRGMLTEFGTQIYDLAEEPGAPFSATWSEPGVEDPHNYDVVFAGLFHADKWSSWKRLGKLMLLMRTCREDNIPVCLYIWDAEYKGIASWLTRPLNDPVFLDKISVRAGLTERDRDLIWEEAHRYRDGYAPPVAVCMHPWANVPAVERDINMHISKFLDPTCFVHNYGVRVPRPEDKERRWTFATVKNHPADLWAHLNWPITYIGPYYGGWRPEKWVVREYAKSWGVLSHGYYHSGVGWWRPRFGFIANMGAVAVCPGELNHLGAAYAYDALQVENMTTDQLTRVAAAQKELWWSNVWSMDKFKAELDDLISGLKFFRYDWQNYSPAIDIVP